MRQPLLKLFQVSRFEFRFIATLIVNIELSLLQRQLLLFHWTLLSTFNFLLSTINQHLPSNIYAQALYAFFT
jgi:hypothetical protein